MPDEICCTSLLNSEVGTIADLNPIAQTLLSVGTSLQRWLPYMTLYRAYAWTIMPGPRHRHTRRLFYRDAIRLGPREFRRWFALAKIVQRELAKLGSSGLRVPVLHVMGSDDYMFLSGVRRLSSQQGSALVVIPGSGHVCSVEAPITFNQLAIEFLSAQVCLSRPA